jgi:peptidoglycan/LPS O-acetylase OafA/YrhL
MKRLPGLDVLRSLAILAVLVHHYPHGDDQKLLAAAGHFGWAGVDLFFVLSGFLIASQFFKSAPTATWETLRTFYGRRFMRTLPAYYVMLVYGAFVAPLVTEVAANQVPDLRSVFFLQNMSPLYALVYTWSLCIEEHFYLFFPFIAIALMRVSARTVTGFLAFVFVGGIAMRSAIWLHTRPDLLVQSSPTSAWEAFLFKIYYPTYTRLDGLLLGVALAALQRFRAESWKKLMSYGNKLWMGGALVGGMGLLASLHRLSFVSAAFSFPLLALGCSGLVLGALSPSSRLSTLRFPGSGRIALLSFSAYLMHVPGYGLGAAIAMRLGLTEHGLGYGALALSAALAMSAALYYGVEQPFLKLRDRLFAAKPATQPAQPRKAA